MATQTVHIDRLTASKSNPRTNFPEKGLKDLGESIQKNGIQVALVVRELANKKLEIVDGERRFRACKLIKFNDILVDIRKMTDEDVFEYQLMTFIHQENISPLDEANAYKRLVDQKKTPEQIAAILAKDESHIVRMLQLLQLIPAAKEAFINGTIFLAHAIEICRLQPRDQELAFKFSMDRFKQDHQPCSIYDLKRFIAGQIHLDLRKSSFSKTDPTLRKDTPACINCPLRTGFNKTLFNDITEADVCTSPGCFKDKMSEHVTRVKTELKADKKKFQEITKEYFKPEGHPDAITNRSYKVIKGAPCAKAVTGIFVDPVIKGKTTLICKDKTCKKHWEKRERPSHGGNGNSGVVVKEKSPEQAEKERIAQVKEKVEHTILDSLGTQIYSKELKNSVPSVLDKKAIAFIVRALLTQWDGRDGVENVLGFRLSYTDTIERKLLKYPTKKLIQIANVASLGIIKDDVNDTDEFIVQKAKDWGLKVEPIEKKIRSDVEKNFADELKSRLPEIKKAVEHSKTAGTIGGIVPKKHLKPLSKKRQNDTRKKVARVFNHLKKIQRKGKKK